MPVVVARGTESDTSDEEQQHGVIMTNTNTNTNMTSTTVDRTRRQKSSGDGADAGGSSERRGSVSFSDHSSGGESSEEFQSLRRQHYAGEWKEQDPAVAGAISSLETNTNTNLNAGADGPPWKSSGSARNPMEAG